MRSPRRAPGQRRLNQQVVQWKPDGFWPAGGRLTVVAGCAPTQFEDRCRRGGGCRYIGPHLDRQHRRPGCAGNAGVNGQAKPANAGRKLQCSGKGSKRRDGLAYDRHPAEFSRRLPDHRAVRRADNLRRRLRAFGSMVGGFTRPCQRQPRVHQSEPRAWYYDTVRVGDPVSVQA